MKKVKIALLLGWPFAVILYGAYRSGHFLPTFIGMMFVLLTIFSVIKAVELYES